MANTAEELGRRYEISREAADEFGYRSHANAKKARDAGWFDEEIEPVTEQTLDVLTSAPAIGTSGPAAFVGTPTLDQRVLARGRDMIVELVAGKGDGEPSGRNTQEDPRP